MIRLADYLYRWTGDMQYLDYIERNIYNGILAQQHPATGQVTYFLPMEAGAKKTWGYADERFLVLPRLARPSPEPPRSLHLLHRSRGCHRRSVHPIRGDHSARRRFGEDLADVRERGRRSSPSPHSRSADRPNRWVVDIRVTSAKAADFALRLRIPWWVQGTPTLTINGKQEPVSAKPSTFLTLKRAWSGDHLRLTLPKGLASVPLPDRNDRVAFMDGPVVLAGLTADDRPLTGDKGKPETILMPDNEREWSVWLEGNYRAATQNGDVRFVPLYSVTDQRYTLYFPVR